MKTLILTAGAVAAAGIIAIASPTTATPTTQGGIQFPAASPQGTLSQRVGMTDIEVSYGRPSMKGRKIFGELEPFGKVWRTGANSSTGITFSTDVQFGGQDVKAGSYSLFSVPGEKTWEVILSSDVNQPGAYAYNEGSDVARVKIEAETLSSPVETFTFGIGNVTGASAHLYFEWETTRVSVPVTTNVVAALQPRIEAAIAKGDDIPYFQAAMFYFENDLDLEKAVEWIQIAREANPGAFYITYRKGLILEKMGDKKGAIAAAKESLAEVEGVNGSVKDEYISLNNTLIERCSK